MRDDMIICDVGAVRHVDGINQETIDRAESIGQVNGMPVFELQVKGENSVFSPATDIGIEELASDTHDEVVPKNAVSRTTARQPAIRSMDEVIKEKYRETIAQELASVIMTGDVDVRASLEKTNRSSSRRSQYARSLSFEATGVYEDTLRFGRHMSFWRMRSTTALDSKARSQFRSALRTMDREMRDFAVRRCVVGDPGADLDLKAPWT